MVMDKKIKLHNTLDRSLSFNAVRKLQFSIPSTKSIISKKLLYKKAFSFCNTLSNPAIKIMISGDADVNNYAKYKDHKKYSDAIIKKCKMNWRKEFKFFKYALIAKEQIKDKALDSDIIEKLDALIEEYYWIPDENKGIDDQKRTFIKLPPASFEQYTDNADYIKCADDIHMLWQGLVRETHETSQSTLIPLPHPYVVPGGRFRELYYWDSYFTIIGLKCSNLNELAKGMVENFLYLVNQFGFIPNGNRSYYLSRSQPPFLALIVESIRPNDLNIKENKEWLEKAYKTIGKEYTRNWMDSDSHYVTSLGLNRYYDIMDLKRPECFGDDNKGIIIEEGFYRHERAECASGMDFTKRFNQRACDFLPVDLNCLLYTYEVLLGRWAGLLGKRNEFIRWQKRANRRRNNIFKYMYNPADGFFYDYDMKNRRKSDFRSIAGVYPMWTGMLNSKQALVVRNIIIESFESNYGIITSAISNNADCATKSEEEYQWDAPNGWAPMQLITIEALKNYGFDEDASRIANKWLNLNTEMYKLTGKFFEKYNVIEGSTNVNTSYPQQDGFGWTNGVYLELLTNTMPSLSKYTDDKKCR